AIVDVALEERRVTDELVVLAAHEDLVACGRDRLLEAEELRVRGEVDRAGAAAAHDADLVRTVAQERRVDGELARRVQDVGGADVLRRDRGPVDEKLVVEVGGELAA